MKRLSNAQLENILENAHIAQKLNIKVKYGPRRKRARFVSKKYELAASSDNRKAYVLSELRKYELQSHPEVLPYVRVCEIVKRIQLHEVAEYQAHNATIIWM